MRHAYSLAHLSALSLNPAQLISAAADAGYDYVGLRLNRTTPSESLYDLVNDRELMRATKTALAATGIRVWDIEAARMDAPRDHRHYQAMLQAAAELGAQRVICQVPDPERQRAVDRFGALCDMGAVLGLGIDLEFVSWTCVPNLEAAEQIIRAVNRDNAGLLVDLLHFDRSGSSIAHLASLPRHWFRWVHVCDAPAARPTLEQQLIHTARRERLFPGEGGIDINGILGALPTNIVYALEIPGETLAQRVGLREYVRRARQVAEDFLERKRVIHG